MHVHAPASSLSRHRRSLAVVLALSASYMLLEAVGGWLVGSLALLADAGHMLSDVAALGLSLFAVRVAQRPPTPRRTYGFYRTEILAALVNGAALLALAGWIVVEALERWQRPYEVAAAPMMAIAAGGLAVNLFGMRLLAAGRRESLNLRGAWLHLVTDTLGSAQALVAGALIWWRGWLWADPLASALIALLVVFSAWSLVRESVAVLMEGAPGHIDVDAVREAMLAQPGVSSVHDLHVWTITSGMESLSAHVVVEGRRHRQVLEELRALLEERFGIDHQTLQLEGSDYPEHPSCEEGATREARS